MSVCLPYTEITNLELAVNKNEAYFLAYFAKEGYTARRYVDGVCLSNTLREVYIRHFTGGELLPFDCATYTWRYRQLHLEGKKLDKKY